MNSIGKGLSATLDASWEILPIFIGSLVIAAITTYLFSKRGSTEDADLKSKLRAWLLVPDFGSIFVYAAVFCFFGALHGYLIGTLSDKFTQVISSLIPGAVTIGSTYIALFHSSTLPQEVRRALAPALLGFLLCFIVFTKYAGLLEGADMPGPTKGAALTQQHQSLC